MKKFLSVVICFVLVVTSCSIGIYAAEDNKYSDYPVILVPGYSSSYFYNGDNGEHVWGIDMNEVLNLGLTSIAKAGKSLGALTLGNTEKIAQLVGDGIIMLCGEMRNNADGTSMYNIQQYYDSAEDSRYSTLMERYPEGNMYTEQEICAEIASYVGYDNLFQFTTDFRMSQESCAADLDHFIEDVCKLTGKDKVNIFAVSHGGQTTSTYITLYGYKNRINNAVLTIPAIGGAGLAYDVLMGDVHLDEECLLRFIEYGTGIEEDFDWLVKANNLGILDDIIADLIPYVLQIVGNWGSMWDFVPADKYEEVKTKRLDPEKNAKIIESSDKYHYEIQPLVSEKIKECNENGAHICIIAGYNNPIVSGLLENSDGIITTTASTGATVSKWGTRFPEGYTQINSCDGEYMVDPTMTVDASTGYTPDTTWYVNGLFHGMTYRDLYTRELMMTLLLTDKIQDVNSNPDFPRFRDNSCAAMGVYAHFNSSNPGYISSSDNKLIITNCTNDTIVNVKAVTIDGVDLKVKLPLVSVLKPGASLEAEVTGDLPKVSGKTIDVNICFDITTITPNEYRTQTFTIINGNDDAVATNTDAVVIGPTAFGKAIGEKATDFLKKLGLYEFFSMMYNIIVYYIRLV